MVVGCGDEISLHLSAPDGLLGQYDVRSECGTTSWRLLGYGKMQGSPSNMVELSVIAPVLLRGHALGGEVCLPHLGRGAEGEEGEEKEVEERVTVAIHRQQCCATSKLDGGIQSPSERSSRGVRAARGCAA